MRILVKYAGKRKRLILDVTENIKISDLKKLVQNEFKLFIVQFRLYAFIATDFKILLTDSFPLSFFNLTPHDIIEIDAYGYKSLANRKKCHYSTYLDNLGYPLKYTHPEFSPLDIIIECCKKGQYFELCEQVEKLYQTHPGEDMLNATHSNQWSPLHYACYYGHAQIVRYLVEMHVNVNRVTVDEWTALQLACFQGHTQCVIKLVQYKNLQINKMTKFRGTALHLSCERNFTEIVKILLDKDAYVSIKDPNGKIAFETTNNREILNLLAIAAGNQELKKYSENEMEPFLTEVYLTGIFFIHDRQVVLHLDEEKGLLNRYGSKEKFQDKEKPELSISIPEIQDVREEGSWLFSGKEEYYFAVETSKITSKYYTKHRQLTLEWIERLQKAANYFLANYNEKFNSNRDGLNRTVADSVEDKPTVNEPAPVNTEIVNYDSFVICEEIGSGSFGIVYRVQKKNEGKVYAMKSLSKRTLEQHKQLKYAISECKIMKQLNHPFIITLHYAFQTSKYLYLILDYCSYGDLLGVINRQGRFNEKTASYYLGETILALEYLHSLNILYRDMKPSNILVDSDGHIKLADFGLAKENVGANNPAMSMAGTPAYLPPETLDRRGTTAAADIYGLGPLLYEMMTGHPIFAGQDTIQIYNNIRQSRITFPPYLSIYAKDLITSVMSKNPERRPTINQLKRHMFFKKLNWQALLDKRIQPPKLLPKNEESEAIFIDE